MFRNTVMGIVAGWSACSLLSLAVLDLAITLGGLKLGDLLLDGLVDAVLELLTVAKLEEKLKPDKQRGQENGLNQIVKQSRSTALESAVADELEDPADSVDSDSDLVRQVGILKSERVASCGGGQAYGGQQCTGNRLQKHVQPTPGQRCQGSQVEVQVGNGEPAGKWDEGSCVGGLEKVELMNVEVTWYSFGNVRDKILKIG